MTETAKPERIIINLDARYDLDAAGLLFAGLDDLDEDADDHDQEDREQVIEQRVEQFTAAYIANAAVVGAEHRIEVEVGNPFDQWEGPTLHPVNADEPDGETWEDRIWQEIHDRTPVPWVTQ